MKNANNEGYLPLFATCEKVQIWMMCRLDSPEMVQSSCLLKMQEKDSVNQLCVKNTYILKVLLPSVYLN